MDETASRCLAPGAAAGSLGPAVTDTAFGAAALELGRASAELGRAHRALARVMAGVLIALHAVAIVLSVGYLLLWHWYDGQPAATVAAVTTVAWDVVFCAVARRRGVGRPLAAASAAIALVLLLTADRWLPPESLGDSGNFVFLAAVNGAVAVIWAFPAAAAGPLVLLLGAGALVGGWGHFPQAVVQAALLVLAPGLLGLSIGRLREAAQVADRRWANVEARYRGEAVVLAVARDRRERERIIHDTVLNTLTGIAWGGGRDVVLARRRCASSLAAVQDLLDPDGPGGPAIDERLAEIADEAVGRGLRVDVDNRLRVAGRGEVPVELPAVVVTAFAGAVRETLANVERHAGTQHARIHIDGGPGVVTVQVSDAGRGFDPDQASPNRLGLRRSVVGRIEDVAGTVAVTSAPGCGTTVRLQWRVPEVTDDVRAAEPGRRGGRISALSRRVGVLLIGGGDGATGRRRGAGGAGDSGVGPGGMRGGFVPDRRRVAAIAADLGTAYAAGLRRAVGNVAGAWLVIMIVPLVATLGWVRVRPVAGLLWLALAGLIAAAAARVRRGALTRGEALVLLVATLGITIAATANTTGGDIVRIVDWPLLVVPLLLAFVTASRPKREWAAALVVTVLLFGGLVLGRHTGEDLVTARLGSVVYGCCVVQIITAMLGPLLRGTADSTARRLAAEAELAAHADSTPMIRRERVAWLGTVERDVLPLLAGVAEGRLDPNAPAVRSRCVGQAAAIRRALTGGGPSSALAELDAVLGDAAGAGVGVEVQRDGDLRCAPRAVRAALADRVGEVLAAAPGGRAIVTVLWSPDGGSVFVTMPWPPESPPLTLRSDSGKGVEPGLGVDLAVDDGLLSLELSWPSS
ncbi:ATP-binding protein [Frankia sp. AgB32]|uniref:ATP-binding protein n=1 Tax=Frankia sp. AgB32 TaxID=631119 RepID=UPI00200D5F23|nr:ATP-binding protein [Frankia sp. AgB32]MCK9895527.1 histidine kinase [Frankia sp. AgB32]